MWPDRDPWGGPFDDGYMPEWAAKVNQPLAGPWRGCLDGVSGDQEWVHKTFTLKRSLAFTMHYENCLSRQLALQKETDLLLLRGCAVFGKQRG